MVLSVKRDGKMGSKEIISKSMDNGRTTAIGIAVTLSFRDLNWIIQRTSGCIMAKGNDQCFRRRRKTPTVTANVP